MATPRLRARKLSERTISTCPFISASPKVDWDADRCASIHAKSPIGGSDRDDGAPRPRRRGTIGTRGAGYDVNVLSDRIGEALATIANITSSLWASGTWDARSSIRPISQSAEHSSLLSMTVTPPSWVLRLVVTSCDLSTMR